MAGSNETRIVLLGKTGAGKSSLGNTILGDNLLKAKTSPNSETDECQAESKLINGVPVKVIDTPGFFDNKMVEEKLKREIIKFVEMSAPEIHAFLIVLNVGRYTDQEKEVINKIKEYFSDEALKHAVVVFTHGDQLEGKKIEDFVKENSDLRELVEKCGGRCHVVDNKYWRDQQDGYRSNSVQVEQLLKTIKTMKNEQGGYTNTFLQLVGKEKEIMRNKQSGYTDNSPQVVGRGEEGWDGGQILKISAGVTVGALLGAFFGAIALGCIGADVVGAGVVGVGGGALGGGVIGASVASKRKTAVEVVLETTDAIFKIGDKILSISNTMNKIRHSTGGI